MTTSQDPGMPPGHYGDDGAAVDRASTCFRFLRSVPILFELSDAALWDLARCAELAEFPAHTRVVSEGTNEQPKRFYVIRSGSADVLRRDRSGVERTIARLSVGSYFGELGLLTNQARNATIRVHGSAPLRTFAFDALTFHRRIAEHVLAFRALRERHGDTPGPHAIPTTSPLSHRLQGQHLDVLERMPAADLEYVLRHAEHRWHPDGTVIVEQGEPGDRFYVLLEGDATVRCDDDDMATLTPGDFFGETALLLDMPRTATVRARGAALTWSITRSAFQRMVGSYLLSNPRTQEEIMRRMAEVLPRTNPPREHAGGSAADQ